MTDLSLVEEKEVEEHRFYFIFFFMFAQIVSSFCKYSCLVCIMHTGNSGFR